MLIDEYIHRDIWNVGYWKDSLAEVQNALSQDRGNPKLIDLANQSKKELRDIQAKYRADVKKREQALAGLQPFVAGPIVIRTANSLAGDRRAIERSAPYFFLPARQTWIDLSAARASGAVVGRSGILLHERPYDRSPRYPEQPEDLTGWAELDADTQAKARARWKELRREDEEDNERRERAHRMRVGHFDYIWPDSDEQDGFRSCGGWFNLSEGTQWKWDADRSEYDFHQKDFAAFKKAGGDPVELQNTVWALLALINTPRIAKSEVQSVAAINKKRELQGVPRILEYRRVMINIDVAEATGAVRRAQSAGRAYHHVRAFLRIKRGKTEFVRPHYRGNRRFGIIKHRYVAVSENDQPGPWMGEALPPPVVLPQP